MSPHRRNSQTLDGACATAMLPEEVAIDHQNGPWPCASPQGCVYNNGSNAEHILITKEDISAGLGKYPSYSYIFGSLFLVISVPNRS